MTQSAHSATLKYDTLVPWCTRSQLQPVTNVSEFHGVAANPEAFWGVAEPRPRDALKTAKMHG